MKMTPLIEPKNRWLLGLVTGAIFVTGGVIYYGLAPWGLANSQKPKTELETPPPITKVSALGRLEPETEIIKLFAPVALDGDRVAKLLVKEGDKVQAGQVIAILDSRNKLEDALRIAKTQVAIAQSKLAQIEAGAKIGDIRAQQATVSRLQAQLQGDKNAQQEAIARLEAQWLGERQAQTEVIARLDAQWKGDRQAQIATIQRLEAQLNNAEAEFRRYQQLATEGAISNSLFDEKGLSLETARQQLQEAKAVFTRIDATSQRQLSEAQAELRRVNGTNSKQINEAKVALNRIQGTGNKQVTEAKATLTSIAEVRPVDVQAAKTEVANAEAALKQAQTEVEQTFIRAPDAGRVMKIHTRPGEKISADGIVELAQTEQMVAVAEVYQSDISKVKLGQPAVITGEAFTGAIKGKVSQIGLQVSRQNVFSNQPGENLDRRVIEVKIRINPEDNPRVEALSNLQVQTEIDVGK